MCDPFWKSLCNQMYWDFIIVICHTVRNRLIMPLSLVSCEHHSVSCALQMRGSAEPVVERERKIKCSLTNINSLKSRTVSLRRRCRPTVYGVGTRLNISSTNNVAFFPSSPEISGKLLLLCLILWSVAPTRKTTSPAPAGCQQILASSSKTVSSLLLFCMFLWMVFL